MTQDKETLLKLYTTMVTIRSFEERFIRENTSGKPIGGGHSSIGQEAVAAGVCAHLRVDDFIASTHRGHGHCLAKGVEPRLMMAELYGRITGSNKGKGGSMHIADVSKGMLGANGVVGSSIPLAVGAALTARVKGTDQVAVAFFGDGGANQGVLYESMNLASVWKLPVIFVCENNRYAESTPVEYAVAGSISERARGFAMPSATIEGQDAMVVYEAMGEAVARARRGDGPTFLECLTYRYGGHFLADDHLRYRSQEEVDYFRSRDCLDRMRKELLERELVPLSELEAIDQGILTIMDEAVAFAESSPLPPPGELYTDVYKDYPLEQLQARW